jgi:hypothetical protein
LRARRNQPCPDRQWRPQTLGVQSVVPRCPDAGTTRRYQHGTGQTDPRRRALGAPPPNPGETDAAAAPLREPGRQAKSEPRSTSPTTTPSRHPATSTRPFPPVGHRVLPIAAAGQHPQTRRPRLRRTRPHTSPPTSSARRLRHRRGALVRQLTTRASPSHPQRRRAGSTSTPRRWRDGRRREQDVPTVPIGTGATEHATRAMADLARRPRDAQRSGVGVHNGAAAAGVGLPGPVPHGRRDRGP